MEEQMELNNTPCTLQALKVKQEKTPKTDHMAPRGQTGLYLGQQLPYIQCDVMQSCPPGI
jgi:hypothetical protein